MMEGLGLTKTMINNARQLSRGLAVVVIYHYREIKLKRFGGRSSVGERPGARAPCAFQI